MQGHIENTYTAKKHTRPEIATSIDRVVNSTLWNCTLARKSFGLTALISKKTFVDQMTQNNSACPQRQGVQHTPE